MKKRFTQEGGSRTATAAPPSRWRGALHAWPAPAPRAGPAGARAGPAGAAPRPTQAYMYVREAGHPLTQVEIRHFVSTSFLSCSDAAEAKNTVGAKKSDLDVSREPRPPAARPCRATQVHRPPASLLPTASPLARLCHELGIAPALPRVARVRVLPRLEDRARWVEGARPQHVLCTLSFAPVQEYLRSMTTFVFTSVYPR